MSNLIIPDGVKKKINSIFRISKVEFCYKEYKFIRREIAESTCPFGFDKFEKDKCRCCRHYGEDILKIEEEVK